MKQITLVLIMIQYILQQRFSSEILKDRAYEIVLNPIYDGYQRGLASMIYKFFDRIESGVSVNEELAQELHKPVIKKLKRRVYERCKDNIWATDLAEMGSLSSKN